MSPFLSGQRWTNFPYKEDYLSKEGGQNFHPNITNIKKTNEINKDHLLLPYSHYKDILG